LASLGTGVVMATYGEFISMLLAEEENTRRNQAHPSPRSKNLFGPLGAIRFQNTSFQVHTDLCKFDKRNLCDHSPQHPIQVGHGDHRRKRSPWQKGPNIPSVLLRRNKAQFPRLEEQVL
jgi:hypothetical protein